MSDGRESLPLPAESSDWRSACVAAGIEPDVVDHAGRCYLMYRDHAYATGKHPTPLVEWFRWFALENAAELSSEKVVVKGCSVDESSVRPPTASSKRVIFELVARYVSGQPPARS